MTFAQIRTLSRSPKKKKKYWNDICFYVGVTKIVTLLKIDKKSSSKLETMQNTDRNNSPHTHHAHHTHTHRHI